MKYKQTVFADLENAKQISESILKGLENRTLSPAELYDLNKRVHSHLAKALNRVGLEYDETR
jgi:hypothetical protein